MKIKVHKNEIICKMKRFENECEKKIKNLKKRKNKQLTKC